MLLDEIFSPDDLKKLPREKLPELACEIRGILIEKASKCGGHLASNLGVVEITIALHYVFNSPADKIIFDVSHQSYVHKILTGRKDTFTCPEKYQTVTGFTNPLESEHDYFNVGHSSTSLSLACGLAKNRDLNNRSENIITVIGDAALDGGEAFEALNYIPELGSGLIIVVNDNNMSIPENHGALCGHLKKLRVHNGEIENNFFKSLGYKYIFARDGHDINALIKVFASVKDSRCPVVVHCCTVKGKGYRFAETNPEKWHHAHPFNIETGEFLKASAAPTENYGSIVGKFLLEKLKDDKKIIAMTASVPACFGFNPQRRKEAGNQFIDVGIAEQNLITMASALAKAGSKPVIISESSFYQRAYDQIEQEMCINHCAVTMLIAFSGIYAHNDNTHIGFFDIALFGSLPNLIYLAPSNKQEYISMLEWSIKQNDNPVAIRIPWNGVHYTNEKVPSDFSQTKYFVRRRGSEVAIFGLGSFFQIGEKVSAMLLETHGINATLIDPMFVSGYDYDTLEKLKENHSVIITLEDGIIFGGFGAKIAQYYGGSKMRVKNFGFSLEIPAMFTTYEMLEKNNLTPEKITQEIIKLLRV